MTATNLSLAFVLHATARMLALPLVARSNEVCLNIDKLTVETTNKFFYLAFDIRFSVHYGLQLS